MVVPRLRQCKLSKPAIPTPEKKRYRRRPESEILLAYGEDSPEAG
jgi:hypothetical protein